MALSEDQLSQIEFAKAMADTTNSAEEIRLKVNAQSQLAAAQLQADSAKALQESQTSAAISLQQQQENATLAYKAAERQSQLDILAAQHASNIELEAKRARLSAVQLAQSTLIANRNNKPVDERDVTADDIIAYAEKIITYIG
jgi:hypothetical protein